MHALYAIVVICMSMHAFATLRATPADHHDHVEETAAAPSQSAMLKQDLWIELDWDFAGSARRAQNASDHWVGH